MGEAQPKNATFLDGQAPGVLPRWPCPTPPLETNLHEPGEVVEGYSASSLPVEPLSQGLGDDGCSAVSWSETLGKPYRILELCSQEPQPSLESAEIPDVDFLA